MSDTPETDGAWGAVSRTPDGLYDSQTPASDCAIAMYKHSRKMERQRNELMEELEAQREYWHEIPSGIDIDADAEDASPFDMAAHIGGLAVQRIDKMIEARKEGA